MLDEHTHKVWGLVVVLQLVHVVRPYTATRSGKLTDPVYKASRSYTPQTNSGQKTIYIVFY